MSPEFSAANVTREVLEHLERHRLALASDPAASTDEVKTVLGRIEIRYRESALPLSYFGALRREVEAIVPARWQDVAPPFTRLEQRGFGLWRGGDLVARLTYLFGGLLLGGLIVAAPFIPIWEKWFPFALAIAAFWLPDVQRGWLRRGYARRLGEIVRDVARGQRALEGTVSLEELMPAGKGEDAGPAAAYSAGKKDRP